MVRCEVGVIRRISCGLGCVCMVGWFSPRSGNTNIHILLKKYVHLVYFIGVFFFHVERKAPSFELLSFYHICLPRSCICFELMFSSVFFVCFACVCVRARARACVYTSYVF